MNEPPGPDRIQDVERRLAAVESSIDEIRDNLLHLVTLVRKTPPPGPAAPVPDVPGRGRTTPIPTGESRLEKLKTSLGLGSAAERPRDVERWLGQNGLLVVGVLALVAAAAFLLKYAFDQGWVSPAARVGAGLVAGITVAAYGERVIRRGLVRFGAAMLGAGAAIAYVSIWAAAGPFQFVQATVGVGALAVVAGLVLFSALRHSEPYLAALAVVGAYLAPILLGEGEATGNVLMVYSVLVSAAGGVAALRRGWNGTFLLVVLGYFAMAVLATGAGADDAAWSLYLTIGGGALLGAALARRWLLEATVAFVLAWGFVLVGVESLDTWRAWILVAAPAALAWPSRTGLPADERASPLLTMMFYGSALGWAVAALEALPEPANGYALAFAGVISLAYLVPAITRGSAAFHLAGLGVLAVGIVGQWDWLGSAAGFAGLAVLAAVTTRSEPLAENRWTAPAIVATAIYALFGANSQARPEGDPALTGRWALTMYGVLAATVAIAGPLWTKTRTEWEAPGGLNLRTTTWLLAALVALVGGTIEIPAFVLERDGSELAAGLAVSVYWIAMAGGLLAYGFWKDSRAVRITGLAFATLAIGKVLFVDLAELRALYRVGSLAALAVIALLAARAYHRRE